MRPGSYTALATPFSDDGVDFQGLQQLVGFQVQNGITGVLAVGTTGESPTLSWDEHIRVIEMVSQGVKGKALCIAGTGSNYTKETLDGTKHAVEAGVDAVLLVDPYYNGPSSLEIRREYVEPVAAAFPSVQVIPYVIPGRTGAKLLPEDLGILTKTHANVKSVKEATADIENMRRTRECCGEDFVILSGDDGMTMEMMTDPLVKASGVISVVSNVAPRAVSQMVAAMLDNQAEEARRLAEMLHPLFGLVTVTTTETSPYGDVVCRARNPLGLKTLMTLLGMPSGGCRRPLGKMSRNGLEVVLSAARTVQRNSPEIFAPLADYFGVDIEARLEDPANQEGLCYTNY